MLTTAQTAVAVAVVAVITFVCRLAPFVAARGREDSPLLAFLARTMPLGVMIVLVAYTLGSVSTAPSSWVPPVAGIAVTAAAHLWRGAIALSLVAGTATYVVASLLLA